MVVRAMGRRWSHVLQFDRAPGGDDRRGEDRDDVAGAGERAKSHGGARAGQPAGGAGGRGSSARSGP